MPASADLRIERVLLMPLPPPPLPEPGRFFYRTGAAWLSLPCLQMAGLLFKRPSIAGRLRSSESGSLAARRLRASSAPGFADHAHFDRLTSRLFVAVHEHAAV